MTRLPICAPRLLARQVRRWVIGSLPQPTAARETPPEQEAPVRRIWRKAELASAEAYFYEGRLELAKQQAKRAKAEFIDGTPNWLIADDIVAFEYPRR